MHGAAQPAYACACLRVLDAHLRRARARYVARSPVASSDERFRKRKDDDNDNDSDSDAWQATQSKGNSKLQIHSNVKKKGYAQTHSLPCPVIISNYWEPRSFGSPKTPVWSWGMEHGLLHAAQTVLASLGSILWLKVDKLRSSLKPPPYGAAMANW